MAEIETILDQGGNGAQPQPGTIVTPGASQSPQTQPVESAQTPTGPTVPAPIPAVPEAPEPPAQPVTETPAPPTPPVEATGPDGQPQSSLPPPTADLTTTDKDGQSITWTASEFVAHDKSAGWYVMLAVGVLLIAALIFLSTRDAVSVAVVIVAGLLLGVYGAHQPRQLEYKIDNRGIGIGQKYFGYDEFRSFSVVPEGAFASIVFMPLKRFSLPTTIYFAPDDEDKILAILKDQIPFEEHRRDAIDSLMRRIRF
jgi:hypothetical protein